jgi:excisionase family DNA binding protein
MQYLTCRQLAERLQVSPRTVQKLAHDGEIPAARVGKQLRFRPDAVESWLQQSGPQEKAR